MGKDISDQFDEIGEDVTAVNTRVDSLAQDTADAKAAAKAAEDKVTELSAKRWQQSKRSQRCRW